MDKLEDKVYKWQKSLLQGTDFDIWGQPVEAINSYKRLASDIRHVTSHDLVFINDKQQKVLGKVATCLELRCKDLQTPGKLEAISLDDLKKMSQYLGKFEIGEVEFPVDIGAFGSSLVSHFDVRLLDELSPGSSVGRSCAPDDKDEQNNSFFGNLLPPPQCLPGHSTITVRIDRIGLKDASFYMDCFLTVSLKDINGANIGPEQDTPLATQKDESCVYFGTDVHIQKPLQLLPHGCAIMFEFKHYKPRKRKNSTKCWSFMEQDEIQEGSRVLELYKKPTDRKRKKINLFTEKPLYLHIKIFIR